MERVVVILGPVNNYNSMINRGTVVMTIAN